MRYDSLIMNFIDNKEWPTHESNIDLIAVV